jgi:hypothetical protein
MMFEENSKMKNIIFMPYIDLPETLLLIYSDQERVTCCTTNDRFVRCFRVCSVFR